MKQRMATIIVVGVVGATYGPDQPGAYPVTSALTGEITSPARGPGAAGSRGRTCK